MFATEKATINPYRTGLFLAVYDEGGGGVVGGRHPPPSIFFVSGPITMKFCTGVDHRYVNSNIKKDLYKTNDVIILRPLFFVEKYTKQKT